MFVSFECRHVCKKDSWDTNGFNYWKSLCSLLCFISSLHLFFLLNVKASKYHSPLDLFLSNFYWQTWRGNICTWTYAEFCLFFFFFLVSISVPSSSTTNQQMFFPKCKRLFPNKKPYFLQKLQYIGTVSLADSNFYDIKWEQVELDKILEFLK